MKMYLSIDNPKKAISQKNVDALKEGLELRLNNKKPISSSSSSSILLNNNFNK
jgi:hypothetical protein